MILKKALLSSIKAITKLEPEEEHSYKVERLSKNVMAKIEGKPKHYTIWDRTIPNGDHNVTVRIFSPSPQARLPVILYFHGGGWISGGIENYTRLCARLSQATGHIVASVEYQLAPEHKFPAGLMDCYAVAKEMFLGEHFLDTNPQDITLMGDSAGGNLAAAVSLMARDKGEFLPRRQILLYPATYNDYSNNSPFPSVQENGSDYILTTKRIETMMKFYQSSPEDRKNPYFAPLMAADFSSQPRTLVITAQYCPLRDEGAYYAQKLREAGIDARSYCMPDALHSFMMFPPNYPPVAKSYKLINDFLRGE